MAAESATTLKAAFSPFTKDPLSELGGPLKLIQAANAAASTLEEFATLLSYTAVISVHMAIFNLLPLSFLDGGHLIMTLREAVSGRAASKRLIKLHWIFSVAFIVALSLLGIYHDLEAIGVLRWLLQNT
jgi:regulator of sigma E protease